MQIDQDKLKAENKNLVTAFREKSRKNQQTQELYDRLKRKEMRTATQSAAFDSVDEALGNVPGRQGFVSSQYNTGGPRAHAQKDFHSPHGIRDGSQQFHARRKSGSSEIQGGGAMMPPPLHRPGHSGGNAFGLGVPSFWSPQTLLTETLAAPMPTPSSHRTQLGSTAHSASRPGTGNFRHPANIVNHTPGQRQTLASLDVNSANRNGLSGYGMSAGMKVGRQQGELTRSPRVEKLTANYSSQRYRITSAGSNTLQPRSAWSATRSAVPTSAISTRRRCYLLSLPKSLNVLAVVC